MDLQLVSLTAALRSELINQEGVTKFSPNRRFATVFSEGSPAEALFFLESGLVKLYKRGADNKELILQIISSGELFGEQALTGESSRCVAAEILHEGAIYVIPRELFLRACERRPEFWRELSMFLTARNRQLEKKVELLCLRDVEYRILYYMAELAGAFGSKSNVSEYSIPLSQGELASLIGATRETTSTTLNALARRGVIRLGRRQLIVPSIEGVRAAADQQSRAAKAP
ncbi:MAG: Crp/Fnr family transcriptional regulator [Bryobacteraceae bacterium]|jgi:CRP/FNR family transcriptional regulator